MLVQGVQLLKLNFASGALDASYSELFLHQILSHFSKLMWIYKNGEKEI